MSIIEASLPVPAVCSLASVGKKRHVLFWAETIETMDFTTNFPFDSSDPSNKHIFPYNS